MVWVAENIQAFLRIFWQPHHQWLARDILHLPQGVFMVFVLLPDRGSRGSRVQIRSICPIRGKVKKRSSRQHFHRNTSDGSEEWMPGGQSHLIYNIRARDYRRTLRTREPPGVRRTKRRMPRAAGTGNVLLPASRRCASSKRPSVSYTQRTAD